MSEDDPDTLRERVRELEQTAADLRETVEQLQQRRGPSRRDLLKVGSGGLLGAGLLASSQPVSAAPAGGDTSAGQVGVAGDSEDIVLDQAFDPGGDEILNVDDSGGVNAQFGRPWYFNTIYPDTLGQDLDADNNDIQNVNSLDTDALAISDHPNVDGVEFGVQSINVGAASDNTTDTSASDLKAVNFDSNFDSAPYVVTGHQARSSYLLESAALEIDPTGFDLYLFNWTPSDAGQNDVWWIAIE